MKLLTMGSFLLIVAHAASGHAHMRWRQLPFTEEPPSCDDQELVIAGLQGTSAQERAVRRSEPPSVDAPSPLRQLALYLGGLPLDSEHGWER